MKVRSTTPPQLLIVALILSFALASATGAMTASSTASDPPNQPKTTSLASSSTNLRSNNPAFVANPCSVNPPFSDVALDAYYCGVLIKMTSYGNIHGYSGSTCTGYGVDSPCFLPNKFITRAEFCQILVTTFRWPINTQGGPHFTDVPTNFWAYGAIETAYNRGIISGYGNGTFIPNRIILRGEVARMASNSGGFNDSPTRGQDFTDVDSNNFAYQYVEKLLMHDISQQFPQNLLPACPTGPPCFFPNAQTPRSDAMMFIFGSNAHRLFGPIYSGQVFARDGGSPATGYEGNRGWHDGVGASVSLPPSGQDLHIAAPVAATDKWNGYLAESGPVMDCDHYGSCTSHPYWSYGDGAFADGQTVTAYNLSLGGYYTFGSTANSDTSWTLTYCDITCYDIHVTNPISPSLPYVAVAGETGASGMLYSTVYVQFAQRRSNGTWDPNYWCPDTTLTPWVTGFGYLNTAGCSQYSGSWSINH